LIQYKCNKKKPYIKINILENINLRSKDYHLDHMVSKCYGFNNKISPSIIGSIHNLKIISAHENLSKQKNCSIDISELLDNFNK
jgi:hypothetical protein